MVFCLLWSNSVYVECVFVEAGSFFRSHYFGFPKVRCQGPGLGCGSEVLARWLMYMLKKV